MRLKLIFLAVLLPFLLGAKAPFPVSKKDDLGKNKEQILVKIMGQRKQILKVSREINSLEKSLGAGNNKYLSVIRRKRKLEGLIYRLQQGLSKNRIKLRGAHDKTQMVLNRVIISSFEKDEGASHLLSNNILVGDLKEKLVSIKMALVENRKMDSEMKVLSKRMNEYFKTERELSGLLSGLEYKKKIKAQDYLKRVKQKDRLQSQLSKLKIGLAPVAKNTASSIGFRFIPPIKDYLETEYKSRGIKFKFRGVQDIHAPYAGVVSYAGKLSTFGNVVMINHGGEIRSIILGHFIPRVKKGLRLAKGDRIGVTSVNDQKKRELYFDVRLKNKVQNTFSLIDKQYITANAGVIPAKL
ncbi:MAG: peptidoglycan DD-metalloendopeptidase family protein [Halobacteriovoraceae bacterium]|nr:peptidoglycan DD-metalloendopeptidase family protein [Halobacteriovoraceae bacterium]MBT5095503.1 peptidoglycan DD-metalloendopeptidase family protein [Halobacteriovoraceae bacterium]